MPSKRTAPSCRTTTRWQSAEYDKLWNAAETEFDPVKRAAMFIRMNDLVVGNVVVIPEIWRNRSSASVTKLQAVDISGWDSSLANLSNWYREA